MERERETHLGIRQIDVYGWTWCRMPYQDWPAISSDEWIEVMW